jgi:hypothetical protein
MQLPSETWISSAVGAKLVHHTDVRWLLVFNRSGNGDCAVLNSLMVAWHIFLGCAEKPHMV